MNINLSTNWLFKTFLIGSPPQVSKGIWYWTSHPKLITLQMGAQQQVVCSSISWRDFGKGKSCFSITPMRTVHATHNISVAILIWLTKFSAPSRLVCLSVLHHWILKSLMLCPWPVPLPKIFFILLFVYTNDNSLMTARIFLQGLRVAHRGEWSHIARCRGVYLVGCAAGSMVLWLIRFSYYWLFN